MSAIETVATREPGATLLVGCGALGIALGERLVARGSTVTAVRRRGGGLPPPFSVIEADLRRPIEVDLAGFESVVITLPPGGGADTAPLYPTALAALDAALTTRPERVVFVSSTRVLEGRAGTTPLTEHDDVAPMSERGEELVAGEALAARLFGATIVRPAGIYGPGRDSLVRRVEAGDAFDLGRRTNRIHEVDLVRLLELLLRMPAPPALVHAVDERPAPLGDVVAHIAARLDAPMPAALDGGGGVGVGGTVLDGRLMRGMLGTLRYPDYRAGYDEMIAERGR